VATWRELKRLRERYSLLADWYGGDFAVTEFAAPQHTPQARPIGELLPAVLKEVTTPETVKLLQLQAVWPEVIGPAFARYVSPGFFRGDDLYVEVSHSALILELQPITGKIRSEINKKLGADFCAKVTLVCSGSKSKK